MIALTILNKRLRVQEYTEQKFPYLISTGNDSAVNQALKSDLLISVVLFKDYFRAQFNSFKPVSVINFEEDLILEIFQTLPLKDLARLSQVCKKFTDILDKQNIFFWYAKAIRLGITLDLNCIISAKEQIPSFSIDFINYRLIINNSSYMDDLPEDKPSKMKRMSFYHMIFDKYVPKNYYLEIPMAKLDNPLLSSYRLLYREKGQKKQIITQMKLWECQNWLHKETYDAVKTIYKPFGLFFKKENGYIEVKR